MSSSKIIEIYQNDPDAQGISYIAHITQNTPNDYSISEYTVKNEDTPIHSKSLDNVDEDATLKYTQIHRMRKVTGGKPKRMRSRSRRTARRKSRRTARRKLSR